MVRFQRRANWLVVGVFAAGIALPLVQQIGALFPTIDVVDNRQLARFPALAATPRAIVRFPDRFEAWYADHMGLRGVLVSGYRLLTDAVLRSPDKVIIGREDWLYLRRGVREDIETVPTFRDWCGRFAFSPRQLESWVSALADNRRWLNERGIEYLFVVPPNKMTVLPQYLPARFQCRRGETRLAQLERALAEHGIRMVDFRDALQEPARDGEPIWHRTDTHWNSRGVAAAYPVLLDRLQSVAPDTRRIDAFDVAARGRRLGDLGHMVHAATRPDINWAVRPDHVRSHQAPTPFPNQADTYGRRSSAREIDDPTLPTAMVFHDSFFDGAMNDFLAESFRRTVFVFHGRPEINRALIEEESPDIVIHEMVERNLLHPFFEP